MCNPNLQNIPKPFEVMVSPILMKSKKVTPDKQCINLRNIFAAAPDHILVSFDYRQIELRTIAHLSRDEQLCKDINSETDIFMGMAASLYSVPVDQVSPEQRQRAKGVCYGKFTLS